MLPPPLGYNFVTFWNILGAGIWDSLADHLNLESSMTTFTPDCPVELSSLDILPVVEEPLIVYAVGSILVVVELVSDANNLCFKFEEDFLISLLFVVVWEEIDVVSCECFGAGAAGGDGGGGCVEIEWLGGACGGGGGEGGAGAEKACIEGAGAEGILGAGAGGAGGIPILGNGGAPKDGIGGAADGIAGEWVSLSGEDGGW